MSKRREQNEEKWVEIIERKKNFGKQEEEVSVKKHYEIQSQRRQEDISRRGG